MKDGRRITMDPSGRLLIPKAIRQEAGFIPGMALEVRCRDGRVELEPAPRKVRIVRKGKLYVAVPEEGSEPLTQATVRAIQEKIRGRDA